MARRFIKPKHDRLFRDAVLGLNRDLSGKHITYALIEVDRSPCPNCDYDSGNDASNNLYNGTGPTPFAGNVCPVCNGEYWITTVARRRLQATVRWARPDTKENKLTPFGELPRDHARIKVPLSQRSSLENAKYFLIDGERCTRVGKVETRGLLTKALAEVVVKRDP